LEENEALLVEQLKIIKDELKLTKQQKETLQKKLDEALNYKDGKTSEIVNMLRAAIEKVISEIQLT
jgi:hypothetical protein